MPSIVASGTPAPGIEHLARLTASQPKCAQRPQAPLIFFDILDKSVIQIHQDSPFAYCQLDRGLWQYLCHAGKAIEIYTPFSSPGG